MLAELFVPGKCYKTMVAFKEPCHLFGDVLHGPLRKSHQKEPGDRRRITKAGFLCLKAVAIWKLQRSGVQRGGVDIIKQEKLLAFNLTASNEVQQGK